MGSRVIGAKAHAARLRRLAGSDMEREVGRALYAAGSLIEVEAELSIVRGSISGKGHIRSRPGEPPRRDTGVLDGNIETSLVEPLKVEVSSNAPYAAALEFGTSKMAARPYLAPATQKKKKEAIELVRRAVKAAVSRTR